MAHEIKTTGDLIEAIKSTDFIEQKHALVREWPCACCRGDILAGFVKGEGFAVDASVMEANASRYHGKTPDELDWTEKQQRKRAVSEYIAALEAEAVADGEAQNDNESGGPEGKRQRRYDRQPPKVISPSDPQSAWTAKANKRVQFGYGLNYLIDIENAVIVDVEETPAPHS